MKSTLFAEAALLPNGWKTNVRVEIIAGKISAVQESQTAEPADLRTGFLLPALANLHSHTFQRAIAGLTEQRGPSDDSFWTWREVMYAFLQKLSPDDIEAIAAFAFVEMLEAGFGSVAEFHYVHHAAMGQRYDAKAELSLRIMAAAQATGLGLTLLPVLYSYSGLGRKPLEDRQLRFGMALDEYLKLHAEAAKALSGFSHADMRLGFAPHSLRAVDGLDLKALAAQAGQAPFHLHIAEQVSEVEQVLAAKGQRPVEWLFNTLDVNENWCLIHATHMTERETAALAKSGAVAGLCPVTEANLGDGIFPGKAFTVQGGRFGVGTDSNVNISAACELCMLEYSQRLKDQKRNVLARAHHSTGENLFTAAATGGAQALGRACGAIATGHWADLMALDSNSIHLAGLTTENALDAFVFAQNKKMISDVWSAGRHCVKDGQHVDRARIEKAYRATLSRVMGR